MSLAWYLFSIAVLVADVVSCSMSLMAWTLTGRRQWLVSAAAFLAHAFEQAIIFFSEYTGDKPYLDDYFKQGLSYIPLSIVLCVALVTLWWIWVCMRVYAPLGTRRIVAFMVVVTVALVVVAPSSANGDVTHNLLYWGGRDLLLIGALVYGHWWYARRASDIERSDIERSAGRLRTIFVMMCVMLLEDVFFIAVFRPHVAADSLWHAFFWHLTQRNISECVIVFTCAYFLVTNVRELAKVFSRHPAENKIEMREHAIADSIDTRLPRYCDEHGMSEREKEVLRLVLQDRSSQQIASELYISLGTVKAHLHRIYTKAGVGTRKDLVTSFWRF